MVQSNEKMRDTKIRVDSNLLSQGNRNCFKLAVKWSSSAYLPPLSSTFPPPAQQKPDPNPSSVTVAQANGAKGKKSCECGLNV